MITKIVLDGFKDRTQILELGRLNLLVGLNGLGKSAFIEGLIFCLSGRVPAGKSRDLVAECFPPRGGLVRVIDDEGRWIMRGIEVDHQEARVSEIHKTEPEEAEGAASIWECNRALLDFRYFVDLSAAKRRDFMLDLVGAIGGKLSLKKGRDMLLLGFAKELGGKGADETCILDTSKLPEKLRPIGNEWPKLWEYVASFDWPDTDASEALTKILEIAKEKKNEARLATKATKSALSELTVEKRGAEIAAEEYREAEAAVKLHEQILHDQRTLAKDIERIKSRRDAAHEQWKRLTAACDAKREQINARPTIEAPVGEEPEFDLAEAERVLGSKVDERKRLDRELGEHKVRLSVLKSSREQLDADRRALAAHQNQPMGHMMDALHGFSEYLDDSDRRSTEWEDLKSCCEEVAAGWRESVHKQKERIDDQSERLAAMERTIASANPPTDDQIKRVQMEIGILASNVERLRSGHKDWYSQLRAAQQEDTLRQQLAEEFARLDGELLSVEKTFKAEEERLTELTGGVPGEHVATAEKNLADATSRLEKLEDSRGAARAYAEAKQRAESAQSRERAWTAFESAVTDAREKFVASLTDPIKADIGEVLTAIGRDEREYLELENARGRPAFNLGWQLGDSRRSINALSHGEATVFGVAVAVAIARRARGRKLLLVEADRIDEPTLEALLEGLTKIQDAFDAVLVSTCHYPVTFHGWRAHEFNESGEVKSVDVGYIERSRSSVPLETKDA